MTVKQQPATSPVLQIIAGIVLGALLALAILLATVPKIRNLLLPVTHPQAASQPVAADFGATKASDDARYVADWVVRTRDNRGADFVIVDKKSASVLVFDRNARLRAWSPVLLGTVPVTLGPQTGAQVNDIYGRLNFGSLKTTNGYCTVESGVATAPLFTYAAEADNTTQDTIFVVGTEDVPAPPGFNPPTATASRTPTATPTGIVLSPTPTPPSGTQTITINVKAWDFNPGGPVSPSIVLKVGTTYRLVFHNVDTPQTTNPRHGFSGISELGLPGNDNIEFGKPDFVIPSFTPQPFQRNVYPFACTNNDCGGDPQQHAGMVGFLIIE